MAIDSMVGSGGPTAQTWLAAAESAIRRECGWHVAPVITETIELDGRGGTTLLLPSGRIGRIIAVANGGVDVTDAVRVSKRHGMLELDSQWSRRLGDITVTLEHGYDPDEVPDVVALIHTLAARGPTGAANVVQQSVAAASVRYGTSGGAALGALLLQTEKDALDPYRIARGAS